METVQEQQIQVQPPVRREPRHIGEYRKKGTIGFMRKKVYCYFSSYIKEHDFAPSFKEVGEALHIAKSGVARHVLLLVGEGYLVREKTGRRTTKLTDKRPDWCSEETSGG